MNCVLSAWSQFEAELRGFLVRRLRDPDIAEDLLHDTFVKALAEGAGFCDLQNPRAWLYRVTRNGLIDHLRQQHQVVEELPEELPQQEPIQAAVDDLTNCLPRALNELSTEDAEAIRLCDLDGMTQADYAQAMGISLPGAKSRVQRARRRLKQHLKQACQVKFDASGQVCCFVPRDT